MSLVLVVDDNLDACHMLARLIRHINGDAACAKRVLAANNAA